MSLQSIVVALLVVACATYASWTLMPATARRAIARSLLKRAWPDAITRRLQRHVDAGSGCGCDGCDRSTSDKKAAPAAAGQPIRFHPRTRR
ncbi:MAG: DUF6587 family protein [Caldimonas sp.]